MAFCFESESDVELFLNGGQETAKLFPPLMSPTQVRVKHHRAEACKRMAALENLAAAYFQASTFGFSDGAEWNLEEIRCILEPFSELQDLPVEVMYVPFIQPWSSQLPVSP